MTPVPVILCGGSGTRLWPLSRSAYPKQLLRLLGERSLLEDTVARLSGVPGGSAAPLVVCNQAQRFLVAGQLAGSQATLLLEPEGRNTAPAAALAALVARERYGAEAILLVLPADHVVRDPAAFGAAVAAALPAAAAGELVTFGIVPAFPETGYGYIKSAAGEATAAWRAVERFVEKPDFETARRYVQSGDYLWNSGIFCFRADRWLEELGKYAPGVVAAAERAWRDGQAAADTVLPEPEAFRACPAISIDYAVMEHTDRAAVLPLDAGWSDVGSWAALYDVSDRDPAGNALVGDIVAVDCRDSYVRSESRLVGVVGLEGCVVVETKDAVLVVPRERSQAVKQLVEELERRSRPETRLGREVFRPWGSYDSLTEQPGFQVKQLKVLPGAVLSLQMHRHRAEHWIVVAGRARITRDDEVFELGVNEHTFIPLGAKHRIENPGTEVLHIVEVQVGDYLGEDDIVRFEDRYGREGRTD